MKTKSNKNRTEKGDHFHYTSNIAIGYHFAWNQKTTNFQLKLEYLKKYQLNTFDH